jgi:biopolymer transport protein TolR
MSDPIGKRGRKIPYKSDRGVKHDAPNSDINVTPLVDVCLVLLIIFMVVTPMLGRGRDVRLPVIVDATSHKEGDQVFVSVDDLGAWIETNNYVERESFIRDLRDALKIARGKAAANRYEGPLLFIKGDRDTHYGKIKAVMHWVNADEETQQHDIALVVDLPSTQ